MKLFVDQTVTGQVILLPELNPTNTILHVKTEIEKKESNRLPVCWQALYFEDTLLDNNDKTLAYYNIKHLSTLQLVEATSARLHNAAANANLKDVRISLDQGYYVNMKGLNGVTPLHVAALEGHTEIVSVLMDAGANVNQQDSSGFTPIMCAAAKDHKETITVLLRAGADVHIKNKEGISALDMLRNNKHGNMSEPQVKNMFKGKKTPKQQKKEKMTKEQKEKIQQEKKQEEERKKMTKQEKKNEEERKKISTELENLAREGNQLFKEGQYDQAILKYESVLEVSRQEDVKKKLVTSTAHLETNLNFVYKILNNIAQCWIMKKEYLKGLEVAVDAIDQGSDLSRSFTRAAHAFKELNKPIFGLVTLARGEVMCSGHELQHLKKERLLFNQQFTLSDSGKEDWQANFIRQMTQMENMDSFKVLVCRVKEEIAENERKARAAEQDVKKKTDENDCQEDGASDNEEEFEDALNSEEDGASDAEEAVNAEDDESDAEQEQDDERPEVD